METTPSVVCGGICPFDDLPCLSYSELTWTFFAEVRMRPCGIWSPLTSPRAPSTKVFSWVRVRARGETRGKNRER